MGIPDHLTCHLRNLYAGSGSNSTWNRLVPNWERSTWRIYIRLYNIYKLSPCLFNFYAEYIMRNAGLEEAQAVIKIAGTNTNNLRYADDTTLMAESEEELKSLLMKNERGEWKSWLNAQHSENKDHGIRFHHFMANRCGKMEAVTDFLLLVPKSLQMVTAAMKSKDACSLEEKLWPTYTTY